jgi:AraC-like DNA-binding protein
MEGISFNIWAVIILFGAAQGIFLSIYFFSKRENRDANKWLALLLTVISLHLLEYSADISGVTLQYPVLLAMTYPLLFCMGPLYFFYCRYLLDKKYKFTLKTSLHFIPALLVLLVMFPFYTMPASEKLKFIHGISNGNEITIPVEQLVFMATHVLQTVAYIFTAYRFIKKKEEELKQLSSEVLAVKKLNWLNTFSFYFSIYFLLYLVLVIVLTFINYYQMEIDYVMLLITSFSIYAIGYTAIGNPELFRALPDLEFVKEIEQNQNPARNNQRHPEIKEKLLLYMETNKPFLKSDLKISELADSLSVPYYQLSQTINDEFLVSFYDFVNKYRVEEARKLLVEDDRNYKILAIAYEVGFNSKATFNRVFKKFTGLTPSEFREKSLAIKNAASSLQSQ